MNKIEGELLTERVPPYLYERPFYDGLLRFLRPCRLYAGI